VSSFNDGFNYVGWIDAYQKRVAERNPDFLKHTISSVTYLKDMFDIIGCVERTKLFFGDNNVM